MIVKCIVAAMNANGEPDFYFVKVEGAKDQRDNGDFEIAASQQAEKEGYEPKLVFTEDDAAGRAILDHFEWDTASIVQVIKPTPPIRKLVNGVFEEGDRVCYSGMYLQNINDYSAASADLVGTVNTRSIGDSNFHKEFVLVVWDDDKSAARMVHVKNIIHESLKHLEVR